MPTQQIYRFSLHRTYIIHYHQVSSHTQKMQPSMINTLRSWANSLKSLVVAKPARHLVTLPPEIRNQIYQHVLVSENTIELSAARQIPVPEEPGLLRTCRQIRDEASQYMRRPNPLLISADLEKGYQTTRISLHRQ